MGDEKVIRPTFGKGGFKPKLVASNPEPVRQFQPKPGSPPRHIERSRSDSLLDDDDYEAPTEEEANSLRFLEDKRYCLEHTDYVRQFNETGAVLLEYILDILEYRGLKDETLKLRWGMLKGHSLEQLCELVVSSAELQWRAKPAWYCAIYLEGYARLRKIIGSMPKKVE